MRRQWTTIIALVLVILIAAFAVMNTEAVPVNFAFTVASWPLIMVILVSLLIGALVAVLISTGPLLKERKEVKQLKKEIENSKVQQEQEIAHIQKAHETELSDKNSLIQQLQAQLNQSETK
ncbi:lipopolysaccharide assembly LapA domain-containing protein [Desemzia sp. FAM 23989]|uniref:LapA family protein n=1 Tax=Desemzia sp. FAM 23989 TaxID=3259523 RepID=UPI0038865E30